MHERPRPTSIPTALRSCALLGCCSIATAALAQPLEVVIQSGHLAEIRDIAFSPDGCFLATAGADNRAKLWDETTGKEIRSLRAGYAPHTAVEFAPDGESLVIAVERGYITQWRLSGTQTASYPTAPTPSVDLSRDGRFMVTGGGDPRDTGRRVTVWDARTGAAVSSYVWNGMEKAEAPHLAEAERLLDHDPKAVAISPTGDYVASAGGEGRTALWRAGEAAPLRFITPGSLTELERAASIVVEFSPDGRYLAGAYRTTAYLWPIDTAAPTLELTGQYSPITALAFSDDGQVIATGNTRGEVWLWDAATGVQLGQIAAHPAEVLSLAFKPDGPDVRCRAQLVSAGGPLDGRILATTGREPVARIWSLGDSRIVRALSPRVQPLNSVAFSPDGMQLALASSADPVGSAKLWDLTSGYDVSVLSANGGGVNAVAFSPQGNLLVTGGVDDGTRIWDARTLAPLEQIGGPAKSPLWAQVLGGTIATWLLTNDTVRNVVGNSAITDSLSVAKFTVGNGPRAFAFDPQQRYVAIAGTSRTVLWDRRAQALRDDWEGNGSIRDLAFTPDGEFLVSAGGGIANRRSITTGKEIGRKYALRFATNTAQALVLLDDGARLALGYDDGLIAIRDIDSSVRDSIQEVQLPNPVTALRLSPSGRVLVAGDAGGGVTVFDYDGRLTMRGSFEAHGDTVFAMDFRPDGGMLATVSSEGTARLWSTETWQEIVTFVSIGAEDYVILSPDNHYAASTNGYYGLVFRRGNTLYPFEQFDLVLNRPDLVFEQLGTVSEELISGYREAYAKRLRRMGVTAAAIDEDVHLPQVTIEDLPRRAATSERDLSFTLVARDTEIPIERLHVWVNEVPLYGSGGIALEQRAQVVRRPVRLRLSEGRNKIQVAAVNAQGAESLRTTIETIYQPPQEQKHDLYVVAIGVSEYADGRYNLAYAAKDASDLVSTLSKQERFAAVHALSILNGDATRERILTVKQLLLGTDVDDEVVLFVAGHGLLDPALNYYFATADIDFANPARRGISDEELEGLLDGIPSRRKLLLMDTCFSGEVDTDAAEAAAAPSSTTEGLVVVRSVRGVQPEGTAPPRRGTDAFHLMEKLFANLGRGSGATLISASGGDEFAFEGTGNGVFTHSILEAIAATDDERFLRLSDLRSRTVARVRQLSGGRQTPSIRRVNLEFDYPVYSVGPPDTGELPDIASFDFGKLMIEIAQIEDLEAE